MPTQAYFIRESENTYRPTGHVSGGWNPKEQHIAPSIGLLTHIIEQDLAARRGSDSLNLTRLSVDILGVIPMAPVQVSVQVLRPGRTIELVEARISHGGRDAVSARAWLSATYSTAGLQGSGFDPMPARTELEPWGLDSSWPGGMVRSVQILRKELRPGRVQSWLRSDVQLLADEEVSPTAHMLRLVDVANGVAARLDPHEVLYPNLDLTAHLFRAPMGELTGLDSASSIGPDGAGLTHSILHDEHGAVGVVSQVLTVRPRG